MAAAAGAAPQHAPASSCGLGATAPPSPSSRAPAGSPRLAAHGTRWPRPGNFQSVTGDGAARGGLHRGAAWVPGCRTGAAAPAVPPAWAGPPAPPPSGAAPEVGAHPACCGQQLPHPPAPRMAPGCFSLTAPPLPPHLPSLPEATWDLSLWQRMKIKLITLLLPALLKGTFQGVAVIKGPLMSTPTLGAMVPPERGAATLAHCALSLWSCSTRSEDSRKCEGRKTNLNGEALGFTGDMDPAS